MDLTTASAIAPRPKLIVIILFIALSAITGLGMGFAFNWPPVLCLIIAALIGSLPMWLPIAANRSNPWRTAEIISLIFLIIVGFGISLRALLPLLFDDNIKIEAAVPLLLMTPPLYVVYMLLNSRNTPHRISTTDYLTTVFSGPPMLLSLAMGITLATYALMLIQYLQLLYPSWAWMAAKFLNRGLIPPITLMLFFWAILLLASKGWALSREQKSLKQTGSSAVSLLKNAHQAALGNLPIAQQSVDSNNTLLNNFFSTVWRKSVDSYAILRYINWAIPILGFIGTVLGISLAADGIQKIINSDGGMSGFSSDLGQAIAPLGIAFDTTLIALSLSILLMLLQTLLQRQEENILIDYENTIRAQHHH